MGDTVVPAEVAELIGQRVGNVVISRLLGQGGMGAVLQAEHPAIGKKVAIKFLSRTLMATPDMASRFLEEARTAASLRHPNIVDIHDFGEFNERPYYVMEFLHGMDLAAKMKQEGRFPVDQVAAHLSQIGEALDLAHGRGVIHRDLKPANVFVLAGLPLRIKLLDFGIAKSIVADGRQSRTQSGQILGTPSHMAPEQVLGDVNEIGPRTDLYALGVILYTSRTSIAFGRSSSGTRYRLPHSRKRFVRSRPSASEPVV
jgi:serine/threonine-protein kinase